MVVAIDAAQNLATGYTPDQLSANDREVMMAGKKNNSWNYWQMNYRGRFRRTKKMIPFIIALCVLLLILGVLADDLSQALVWIVLLAAVGVAQYFYTKKKADEEEAQERAAQNATAQAAPGAPGYAPQGSPAPQGYAPAGYPAATAAPNAAPATPGYASAPNYSAPASAAPQAPFAPGAAPQAPIPSPEAQNAQPSAPTASNAQAGPTVPPTTAAPAPNVAAAPQQGGTNPFEQETGSLQMQMAYLAASLPNQDAISNGTIQTVYVHAAVQNGAPTWDCFFRSGNALVASGDLLKNTPAEARSRFFDSGRALVSQYLQACAKYGVDAPTELRITYDPRTHSLHTDVNYQPLTGTGDQDPFMVWASSVYASFSGANS